MARKPELKRVLSLPLLVLYGLGTTIGAGIYALIGKVADVAGFHAPLSFLVASLLAGVTALSFAELSVRFPKSAGEAVYVRNGLRSDALAVAVGFMVIAVGLVSAAAVVNGFAGYFKDLVAAPRSAAIIGVIIVLGGVAAWGIGQSVAAAAAITLVEVGGLAVIIWGGHESLAALPAHVGDFLPPLELGAWTGLLAGAFLAFYAFIGFEDMVNVAEEVRDVSRNLPLAIVITFVATLVLYLLVAAISVLALPPRELAASPAPLSLLFERTTGASGSVISAVAILATINGALIQIIMASRILYGLAAQELLPPWFGQVHPKTRTPVNATAAATGIVLVLALPLGLAVLAQITSALALVIFALVNLSLWRIKERDRHSAAANWRLPRWVPAVGFLVTVGFLAAEGLRLAAS